jgi:hypothetical protein
MISISSPSTLPLFLSSLQSSSIPAHKSGALHIIKPSITTNPQSFLCNFSIHHHEQQDPRQHHNPCLQPIPNPQSKSPNHLKPNLTATLPSSSPSPLPSQVHPCKTITKPQEINTQALAAVSSDLPDGAFHREAHFKPLLLHHLVDPSSPVPLLP